MAYYEDRRYPAPRDRARPVSYAADYYDSPRYERHDRQVYPDESVEEIQRDYPPGEGYVYERGYDSRRSRRPVYENVRRASSVSGHDPYYDGYYRSRARPSRQYDDRRPRRSRYSSLSPSPSPPRHRRRKSFSEQAMSAIGLGSAASRDRDRGRDRDGRGRASSRYRGYSSDSRSRSRSRDRDRKRRERSEGRISQAARAALTAGAVEAFRSRKDPGEWTGEKGKRVLTAAVTAAGTDGLVDRDPKKHSKRHMVESTLAGLAATHFMNGGRSQSRGRNSRDRKSSGGLKDLAASGAIAAAGKEIYDRFSRSRSRPRERGRSSDSDDDRRGSKKRSKSVSEYISKGMAALGLGEEGSKRSDDGRERGERRRHRDSRRDRSNSYSDSDADSDYYRSSRDPRRGRGSRDVGRYRSVDGRNSQPPYPYNNRRSVPTSAPRGETAGEGALTRAGNHSHSSSESDSDLGDSDDEKKKHKKMRRDMMLTGGLATVATVHAAHSLYGSVQKRKKRLQELEEGKITPEEARKLRMKANTLDAVSVGLAALGIKGAYAEWEEVNEKRKEHKHFQEECEERAKKRLIKRSRSQTTPKRHRWPDEIEYPPSRNGSLAHNNASSELAQLSY
ncbi:uncharacterized protein N7484_010902 [Penicillium longicatenatum]|uniref:uncharacterized protein n=1 Tax=Penicillium longicatenatum TaxID=1561947 RepID=UPI0025496D5C|nr:uncharacterized protein N7484_010902 [Penicillium longicatenatum]KAJ5630802.1 hypothetical protein N7484_010902 [Penicillium longicatenatum]